LHIQFTSKENSLLKVIKFYFARSIIYPITKTTRREGGDVIKVILILLKLTSVFHKRPQHSWLLDYRLIYMVSVHRKSVSFPLKISQKCWTQYRFFCLFRVLNFVSEKKRRCSRRKDTGAHNKSSIKTRTMA